MPSALSAPENQRVDRLHERIEQTFAEWLDAHYASLHSLAYWPHPVMVHHLPHFLAHGVAKGTGRRALVVVDGLAIDQWTVARHELPLRHWSAEESAIFAWVPTLTAVSRQSIFAGDPPFFFASSIATTQKEPRHWSRFWGDRGLRRARSPTSVRKARNTMMPSYIA